MNGLCESACVFLDPLAEVLTLDGNQVGCTHLSDFKLQIASSKHSPNGEKSARHPTLTRFGLAGSKSVDVSYRNASFDPLPFVRSPIARAVSRAARTADRFCRLFVFCSSTLSKTSSSMVPLNDAPPSRAAAFSDTDT